MSTMNFTWSLQQPVTSLVRTCSHDFPVGIIPRSQWSGIHEAEEHSYDVSIEMPYIREMHQWLECFKSLGQHCYLVANGNGDFQAKLVHDMGTCVKQFTGLQVVHEDGDHRGHDLTRLYGVRVDRRKLVAFLALEHSFPPDRVLQCDISERKLVHLQLVRGDAVLHFFCRHVIEDVAVHHTLIEV
ncbi:Checkpoint protein [Gryllus bimaculatus]|nr:Checkpoint protein [Gryllus bimaculatus]